MRKTAKGLVEYCKAQLGKPYWWGTFGQAASASLYAAKKQQYPGYYQWADFEKQYGQRVHDCVGLIKGYRWSDTPESAPKYVGSQDVAVGGLYKQCREYGSMGTMPDVPGVCVFMADMGHVGVYIGGGEVIEAMGHAYGVVKTKLAGRGWSKWGMPSWIDYGAESGTGDQSTTGQIKPESGASKNVLVYLPELSAGAKGEAVRTMQTLLIAKKFTCGSYGADGEFGSGTLAAVRNFQRANGLYTDGCCGVNTWAKLLRG